MAEERIFFDYGGVTVTNMRFIVKPQTFAMSNITSVKASEQKPSRLRPVVLIAAGAFSLLGNVLVGIVLAGIGIAWLLKQTTMYHVMLTTAGGEISALRSEQRQYVEKVVKAVNDAILARG
jgi:hypothetical protein